MANYTPFVRSNFFAVKDAAKFERFCKEYDLHVITPMPMPRRALANKRKRGGALVGFLGASETGIPLQKYDPELDQLVETDFCADLAAQLKPGWVAVVMEIGYEAMRYLHGYAVAVNASGKTTAVDLRDIYARAKRLGAHVTPCEY